MEWYNVVFAIAGLVLAIVGWVFFYISDKALSQAEESLRKAKEQSKLWDVRMEEDIRMLNALIKKYETLARQSDKQSNDFAARVLEKLMEKLNER